MSKHSPRGRSAITGQFVSNKFVKGHPKTTVTEIIMVGPVKKRK